MTQRTSMSLIVLIALVLTVSLTLSITQRGLAQGPTQQNYEHNDNCLKCHEDLYLLHDTGNWYCIRESPMTCTECHGGNANAITAEEAHLNRAAHPVINEDISKCQECHPDECYERMEIFNQEAGISEVLIAAPYTPVTKSEMPIIPQAQEPEPNLWIDLLELLPLALLAGAAVTVFAVYRIRHRIKSGL